MNNKNFFSIVGLVIVAGLITAIGFHYTEPIFGAPLTFISTPATTTPTVNFGFTIGTTTPLSLYGSTTLAIYGSTTIQTSINTLHAFRIINAASSTVFGVDTVNASTTVAGQLNAQTLTVTSCTGCGAGLSGGSLNALVMWSSATAITSTSTQPLYVGSVSATTSATSTFSGGLYASLISAPYFHATSTTFSTLIGGFVSSASSTVQGLSIFRSTTTQATTTALYASGFSQLAGGLTLTCTSCITDVNVTDVLTVGATGSVDDGALSVNVAHLNVAETIASNWVNTTNPWADNEVIDALTISAGTVNNSAIGATTPLTGAFTTLSATGLTSLYGNLTATSTINFSGGYFIGVASSSLALNNSGALGVDTTSGQLRYRDDNATQVLSATSSPAFLLSSSTLASMGAYDDTSYGTTTIRKAGEWNGFTVNAMRCVVTGTSTAASITARIGDGSASSSFVVGIQTGVVTQLSSNNTFTSYEDMYIELGSKVQAPDSISCSLNRKFTSD